MMLLEAAPCRDASTTRMQESFLTMTIATAPTMRSTLPSTRRSVTHKFWINGTEGYLTVGLFEDGSPGEIFMKVSKEGTVVSGLIQGFCRAFSLSLQHGLDLNDAVSRFEGMTFEPMGQTRNPEIPEVSSILDYVARYLRSQYGHQS
jgi:ribonucleoside-diphosphate reductase alpha chain